MLYAKWAVANGLTLSVNSGSDDDPDGDLIPYAGEYSHGLNPLVPDGEGIVLSGTLMPGSPGLPIVYAVYSGRTLEYKDIFTRWKDHYLCRHQLPPQFSNDMSTRVDGTDTPNLLDGAGDPDYDLVSVPFPAALVVPGLSRLFRVEIEFAAS